MQDGKICVLARIENKRASDRPSDNISDRQTFRVCAMRRIAAAVPQGKFQLTRGEVGFALNVIGKGFTAAPEVGEFRKREIGLNNIGAERIAAAAPRKRMI